MVYLFVNFHLRFVQISQGESFRMVMTFDPEYKEIKCLIIFEEFEIVCKNKHLVPIQKAQKLPIL